MGPDKAERRERRSEGLCLPLSLFAKYFSPFQSLGPTLIRAHCYCVVGVAHYSTYNKIRMERIDICVLDMIRNTRRESLIMQMELVSTPRAFICPCGCALESKGDGGVARPIGNVTPHLFRYFCTSIIDIAATKVAGARGGEIGESIACVIE
jgi:hypothetical protein